MSTNLKMAGIVSRILCGILLVFLGFAHKPVIAAPFADIAAYVLPDGTVSSFCIPDQDGKQGKHVDHGCEACRIASSVTMPTPPLEAVEIARNVVTVSFVFTPERFHRLNFPPSAPPRGPPAIPVSFVTA